MKLYIIQGAAPCGKTLWLRRFVAEHQEEGAAYFTGEQICDIAVALASSRDDETRLAQRLAEKLSEKKYFSIDDIDYSLAGKPTTQAVIAKAIASACTAGSIAAIAARDGKNCTPILWEALTGYFGEDIEYIVPNGLSDHQMRGDGK